MNRTRFLVAVLALGGLVGAAQVRSSAAEQQKRVDDFLIKATAARKAQKLDTNRDALMAKYPTPEVSLSTTVEARPGSEHTLTVRGQFVPGTIAVIPCEGVEVLSTNVTADRIEAKVRVLPHALPSECDMQIVTPVSGVGSTATVLRIQGSYEWDLKLANGMTTRFTASMAEDGHTLSGQSEWNHQGKSLGKRVVVVSTDGEQGVRVDVETTEEESNAAGKALESGSVDMDALSKKMDALMQKSMAECAKGTQEQQATCQDKYRVQMEALTNEAMAQTEATVKAAQSVTAACSELKLKAVGGQVSGTAHNCGGAGVVKVTGTYKALPAK